MLASYSPRSCFAISWLPLARACAVRPPLPCAAGARAALDSGVLISSDPFARAAISGRPLSAPTPFFSEHCPLVSRSWPRPAGACKVASGVGVKSQDVGVNRQVRLIRHPSLTPPRAVRAPSSRVQTRPTNLTPETPCRIGTNKNSSVAACDVEHIGARQNASGVVRRRARASRVAMCLLGGFSKQECFWMPPPCRSRVPWWRNLDDGRLSCQGWHCETARPATGGSSARWLFPARRAWPAGMRWPWSPGHELRKPCGMSCIGAFHAECCTVHCMPRSHMERSTICSPKAHAERGAAQCNSPHGALCCTVHASRA